jgi:hypothetical protein
MRNVAALLGAVFFLSIAATSRAAIIVMSDFDDGTLQAWTAEPPFGGSLSVVNTGGNPDGFMAASDTSGGGRLLARAPGLSGDLSLLSTIQWDEYLYNISQIVKGTNVFIRGTDGTLWESDRSVPALETWVTKSVDFSEPSSWSLVSGTASYGTVIADADGVFINMGTSTAVVGLESGVDNIVISTVPVPASIWLVGSGVVGLVGVFRRTC